MTVKFDNLDSDIENLDREIEELENSPNYVAIKTIIRNKRKDRRRLTNIKGQRDRDKRNKRKNNS